MKKLLFLLTALAIFGCAATAGATAMLDQGTSEMGIGGWLDFTSADGTEASLDMRYAYFLIDRLSLGGLFDTRLSRHSKFFAIGPVMEYNFGLPEGQRAAIGTDLVPYVGGSILFAYSKVYDFSEHAFVFQAEGGLKFFLTDTAAVALGLIGSLATDKVYADDDKPVSWNIALDLGMRLYF